MRHWPLTQLALTTPDLVLRMPTEPEPDDLAQVAAEGVHPPGAVHFPSAVIFHNALDITEIVRRLQEEGYAIDPEVLAHILAVPDRAHQAVRRVQHP